MLPNFARNLWRKTLRGSQRNYWYNLGAHKNKYVEAASGLKELTYMRFEFNLKTVLSSVGLGFFFPIFIMQLCGNEDEIRKDIETQFLQELNALHDQGIEEEDDDE